LITTELSFAVYSSNNIGNSALAFVIKDILHRESSNAYGFGDNVISRKWSVICITLPVLI